MFIHIAAQAEITVADLKIEYSMDNVRFVFMEKTLTKQYVDRIFSQIYCLGLAWTLGEVSKVCPVAMNNFIFYLQICHSIHINPEVDRTSDDFNPMAFIRF